ncbi:MAG: YggS family pyridoxal phosphate-dependent enzyme [Coriobacteriales bacterium]|nr:YggS family pyridoxal phosphate-dependent enzyme [Coriobacteriales bacterium]
MLSSDNISQNIKIVRQEIDAACKRSGRTINEVRLVAVSKTVGLSEVEAAVRASQKDFGENRTTELQAKASAFPLQSWHFIGRLQSNKLKDIVGVASLIHSVAKERTLKVLADLAGKRGVCQDILIEVNVSGEQSKDGVSAKELLDILMLASELDNIIVRGLMTMAPLELGAYKNYDDSARATFSALRELRDSMLPEFAGSSSVCLHELSMGMSDDYAIAVEEGATIVRVGRAIWR